MRLMLVVIFSLTFMSCGKHQQTSKGNEGIKNINQVQSSEVLAQKIIDEDLKSVEDFLNTGGSVDYEFQATGRTLLTEACFWSKLKIIELLVRKGSDLSLKDKNGLSGHDYGELNIKIKRVLYPELVIELKKKLLTFVKANNLIELKKILEEKPPLNFYISVVDFGDFAEGIEGETLLSFVLKAKLENTLRLLAQPKYELDVNLKNKKNESPLFIARANNLKNSEKILLKLGAIE